MIPDIGNILTREGMGPRILSGDERYFPGHQVLWALVTIIAISSFSVVAAESFIAIGGGFVNYLAKPTDRRAEGVLIMALAAAIIAYAPYGLHYKAWFDRYVILTGIVVVAALAGYLKWDRLPTQISRVMSILIAVHYCGDDRIRAGFLCLEACS